MTGLCQCSVFCIRFGDTALSRILQTDRTHRFLECLLTRQFVETSLGDELFEPLCGACASAEKFKAHLFAPPARIARHWFSATALLLLEPLPILFHRIDARSWQSRGHP